MKTLILSLSMVSVFFVSSLEARDLTYKMGFGYRQAYTGARVDDATVTAVPTQVNGLEATYGLARDIQAGAYFGFEQNFDFMMLGPKLRYDIQRLVSRDMSVWNHLNIFTEAAFLVKFGGETKSGVCIHAPDLGFEILPFEANNFAILTSAGFVFDFVKKNRVSFTNAMFGDVGVKYYF